MKLPRKSNKNGKEKKLYDSWDLKDMIDVFYKYGGIIKDIARHMNVSIRYIHEYKDVFPEIQEAYERANGYLDLHVVESSYEKLDKLIKEDIEDPALAFKAVTLALTKSKKSRYYEDKKKEEASTALNPAQLSHYARLVSEEETRKLAEENKGNS
jgi:hypothetical protein